MEKLELKHLAPYLPYRLRVKNKTTTMPLTGYYLDELEDPQFGFDDTFKPILRPLSDLTEKHLIDSGFEDWEIELDWILKQNSNELPYGIVKMLLKNHFDVFGLIEKGLAIDINTIK